MFENVAKFFKKFGKNEKENSGTAAKERLHLVLTQDRANISADFLEMMKQEIIDVIKKYIDIDEEAIDVRMTNKPGEDGTFGVPSLYANIPIVTIKNETRKLEAIDKKDEKSDCEESKKQNVEIEVNGNLENSRVEIANNIKDEAVEKIEESPNKEEALKQDVPEERQTEILEKNKEEVSKEYVPRKEKFSNKHNQKRKRKNKK